ncbi:MAG: hypothetical protein JXA61_05340 [Bacteroidales bacterium]|nr:hypothetical protein [Bacteroidales bacterium]
MEEKYILKYGFRNVYQAGRITGFQFKFVIPYYRGIYLSCLDEFSVKVDGENFSLNNVSIKIGERIFPWKEVDVAYDVFWTYGDPATVIVSKPGGLETGLHTIELGMFIRKSYIVWTDPEGIYDFVIPPLPKSELPDKDPRYGFQTFSDQLSLVI